MHDRVLAILERHGWNATSFQILEPGFSYWFDGDDACVGYVDTGTAWVAAGPPIAAIDKLAQTSDRFVAAARAAKRRVCLFGTEARFRDAAHWPSLRIGEQPIWDPATWPSVLASSKSLREQLRRARAKGVVVREFAIEELAPGHVKRAELDAIVERWLSSRAMAPMGFLVQVEPFAYAERRHYFAAEVDGRIVAFLGVMPIYARKGWLFRDFLRDPAAPNGTVELLVDAAFKAATANHIELVTLGLAPLAGEVGPLLKSARAMGRPLYDFEGLRAFKAKLKPNAWDPIFLSYPPHRSSVFAVIDTLTAFARGGLLKFGVQSMLRGPAIVIRLLAALLVVWTVLLALPLSAPFFPSPVWQWSWVGFDIALFVSLFTLARRWRQPLADIVTVAVTADAVITTLEAIVYNAPRVDGWIEIVAISLSVLAPSLAALMLWNARGHRTASD